MYTFNQGDLVKVTNLQNEAKVTLSQALGTPFRRIKFYFVEHESDDMVVLSAETDDKFAIVHCPVEALENHEFKEEIDALLDHLLLDFALARKNEEMFTDITNRMKQDKEQKEFRIGLVETDKDALE